MSNKDILFVLIAGLTLGITNGFGIVFLSWGMAQISIAITIEVIASFIWVQLT